MDSMLKLTNPKAPIQPPLLNQLQQRQTRWPGAPRARSALTTVAAATRLISRQAHHRLRLLSLDRQAATFRWPLLRLAYRLAHQPEMPPLIRSGTAALATMLPHAGRNAFELLSPSGAMGRPQRNQAVTAAQAWGIVMPGVPHPVWSTAAPFAPASLPALARLAPMAQRPAYLNAGLPGTPPPISEPSGPVHSALIHDNRAALWRTGAIPFLPMQPAASERQPIVLPFLCRPLSLAVRTEAPRLSPTLFGRTAGMLFRSNRSMGPSPLSSTSDWGAGGMALPAQQPIGWLLPAHAPPVAQIGSTPARTLVRQAQEQPARLRVTAPVSPVPRLPVNGPRLPSATQALDRAAYRPLGAEPPPGTQLRRLATALRIAPPPGAVPVSQPLPQLGAAVAPWPGNAEAVPMTLQPRTANEAATAPPAGQRPPAQRLSRGSAVEPGLRTRLEKTVGFDLGTVRLHTDSGAAALAAHMHAQAFTVGSHIFFAAGRFQPQTQAGQALLLHELLHVRQQPGGLPLAAGALTAMQQRTLEQEAQTGTALLLRGAPSSSLGGSYGAVGAGYVHGSRSADPVLAAPGGDSAFPRLHLAWPTHTLTTAPLRQEESASRPVTPAAGTPGPTPPSAANAAPPVDLERLAQQVYTWIERRQRFEQERRGIQLWR
ncbi:MAG: DUF4157 domain-containing protein [Caldilinea sp. CFX5]|nr:DUF4157 domain-containing protein [Caldilinea sp. CFX5]